jgi:tRNA pseudouridine38-40 synthase
MLRYLIELSYLGTNYSGFQIQKNANTIQAEVEKALAIILKSTFQLTGSSRTDAGVHAKQNFFHFDSEFEINQKVIYNINAVLPPDIVIKNLKEVNSQFHARFSATSREYQYIITQNKNPFLINAAYYYPYNIDTNKLMYLSEYILHQENFTSFSKKNSQVNNHICKLIKSNWESRDDTIIYNVQANRFLRGMVRSLVATMLSTSKNSMSILEFENLFNQPKLASANFSTPAHGLTLINVHY